MKKTAYITALFIFFAAVTLYAAKPAKPVPVKQPAPPVITSAVMLAEELQKRGVKGEEEGTGVLPSIFGLIGLRQYRKISGDMFYVQVYDFKSSWGFNVVDAVYRVYGMFTSVETFKSRPYIIVISSKSGSMQKKISETLKKIIPDVKEAGSREY